MRGEIAAGTRFDDNAMYQNRYWHGENFDAVAELQAAAAEAGHSLVSLSLNWLMHHTTTDSYQLGDLYSLSGPQDNDNIRLEKGPSPNDIRHRFVSDFIYELPFARYLNADTRAKKLLLGGWQFTGIYQAESGAPFHIAQGGALTNQRIDLLADPYLDGAGDRLNYLSRAAVARAPFNNTPGGQVQARPGTMGRNALRGPGFWNIDLALSKNLAFTERYRLQLRVDMFNAFNHTAFSGINMNLDSSTFGRFTSTRGARTVQLNAVHVLDQTPVFGVLRL